MNALVSTLGLFTYDATCALAQHELPHPVQPEIESLGHSLANEMLDAARAAGVRTVAVTRRR